MAESMPPVMRNHDGLSYEERWALWQDAKALSCRIRARRQLRTSSAQRVRVSTWQRLRGIIQDAVAKVREETPTIHSVIARAHGITARLFQSSDREWRFADVIRRQPGLTAWCFLFLAVVIVARVSDRQPALEPGAKADQQRWLRARTAEAVSETLAIIRNDIRIHAVEAKPLRPSGVIARYRTAAKAVIINSDWTYSETELLRVAGHECVHAIFHQAGLWPQPVHQRQYGLLNETAAYVLGAHIAGRAWSRRGLDGEALTARLIREHREACDPTLRDSVHWRIAESYGPDGRSFLTTEEELGLSGHFGSPAVVDEMDRLCRLHFEPVDAARAIAERYGRKDGDDERPLVVRADLRPDG